MLKIITVPDPILLRKTEPVKQIDQEILNLIVEMIETCRKANGIGLAAPQIGRAIRLAIINLEHLGLPPFAVINPKITKKSWRKIELEEGCLSIPGWAGLVNRHCKLEVKAQNIHGKPVKLKVEGFLARVFQHEHDHLEGVLFTDHITDKEKIWQLLPAEEDEAEDTAPAEKLAAV